MLQPCLPRGLFTVFSQGLQVRAVGEGEALHILCLSAAGRPVGKVTASALVVGMMARRMPGVNHHCSIPPARQEGPQAGDAWLGRAQVVPFCLLMQKREGETSAVGKKEGPGRKARRLTNKQKSPNPSERRLQNKLKLLWQLVCVGSNMRLRTHGIKTSVMLGS